MSYGFLQMVGRALYVKLSSVLGVEPRFALEILP